MTGNENTSPRLSLTVLPGLQLLGLFAYLWLGLGSHLLFYGFGVFCSAPVFIWDRAFLIQTLTMPGEPVRAMAGLLAAGYLYPWLGALILTAAMGLVVLSLRRLFMTLAGRSFADLAWGLPLLALMLLNRCDDALPDLLGAGLSTGAALLYCRMALGRSLIRAVFCFACCLLLYLLAGGWVLNFAALLGLHALLRDRRGGWALVPALLTAASIYLVGRLWLFLETDDVWLISTPWHPDDRIAFSPLSNRLRAALFLYAPTALLLSALTSSLYARIRPRRQGKTQPDERSGDSAAAPRSAPWNQPGLRAALVSVILLLGVIGSRSSIRYERLLHYHATLRNWDQVLTVARRMRGRIALTRAGLFDINRALAHRRELSDRLCAYPQTGSQSLFLSHPDMAQRVQFAKMLELYLDLGDWHAAERNAYELFEYGDSGLYALDAMLRIHRAKGQQTVARMVLGALQKHAGWRGYLRLWREADRLETPAGRGPIVPGQAPGRRTNYINYGVTIETLLARLLRDHPDNGLAFEYLLACCLLERRHAKVVHYLPALRSLGYRQLPRHVAEAVFVHGLLTQTPANHQGWPLDNTIQAAIEDAMAVVQQAGDDSEAAYRQLAPRMGDTYTFYCLFGVCGVR
jgi:hypothetical protein